MKNLKIKKYIFISLFIIIIFTVIGIILFNNYSSRVIIAGPFSITINSLTKTQSEDIKIFGYSPFNKLQKLVKQDERNVWEYNDHSGFKNLFILFPDSNLNIKYCVLKFNNKQIIFNKFQKSKADNELEIKEFPSDFFSESDVLKLILNYKEVKILIIAMLFLIVCVIVIKLLYQNRKKIKSIKLLSIKKRNAIFFSVLIILVLSHFVFFIITRKYLITSGIVLIILCYLIISKVIVLLKRWWHLNIDIYNVKLLLISFFCILGIVELLFILLGYMSTYGEKSVRYYYTSPYLVSSEKGWFFVWGYDHNLKNTEFSYPRDVNSDGLSDKEHSTNKTIDEYRIIGLGDSFTEGAGADADSTWLKFLERDLNKYYFKKKLEYFNAGVSNSDLFYEFILLEKKLLKYKPDMVLLTLNNSDIRDIYYRGGLERFRDDGSVRYNKGPWWEPVYAISHISRLCFSALGYNEMLYKEKEEKFIKEKKEILEILDSFNNLANRNNFSLVVIFHPTKEEIISKKLELDDVYSTLLHNNKIDAFNMYDYFNKVEKINADNYSKYYWLKDGHHNSKGYEVFALGVEYKLITMGIIDSLSKK